MSKVKTAAEPLQREIGGVNYIVARKYKENSNEDAASKMARIIRNETLRLLGDKKLSMQNGANKGNLQNSDET